MSKYPRILIVRRPTGYVVRVVGANGEILSVSEVIKLRRDAWKNYRAQHAVFDSVHVIVDIDERPPRSNPERSAIAELVEFTEAYRKAERPPRAKKAGPSRACTTSASASTARASTSARWRR